jgi:hypothetical protein
VGTGLCSMQISDFPRTEIKVVTLPQLGDAMATNKETLEEHEKRLQEIEARLGLSLPAPRKTLKERLKEWDKARPWIKVAIPIILPILTVLFAYWLNHRKEWWNGDVAAQVNVVLEKPDGVLVTLKQVRDTVDRTDEKLKTLEPFIHDVIEHQFENAAKLPTGALIQRIPALNNLVAVARTQNVTVDPHIVTEVGTRLVDASGQNAEAWEAVLRWVDYKSFNNSFSPSLPDTTNAAAFRDKYVINIPPDAVPPTFSLKGLVPADIAAQTGYIGHEDRNKGMTSGPEWIIAEGGAVGLDGMYLRNVVFHNVHIQYFGAPLTMKNVYFIDCTFDMKIEPKARQLAVALLAPTPSTSF